jgi:Domain of unknown function (DUF4214)
MKSTRNARGHYSLFHKEPRTIRPAKARIGLEQLEDRTVPSVINAPPIYQNPFMAPNDFSEIHLNSQQTDTFSIPGPASTLAQSVQQKIISAPFAISGTIAFNSAGQLVTIRVGLGESNGQVTSGTQTLLLIDPSTLETIDSVDLPPRPAASGTVSFAGGGYFYLDNSGRVVCVTADQQIQIYATDNNQLNLVQSYNLAPLINNPNDILNSVLPDSSGNLWFITDQGDVGNVNPSNGAMQLINIRNLPNANPAETDTKSFATDGNGGVFVVSDYALYRFHADSTGVPVEDWRSVYDRGVRVKPGQNQQGSGTTPTVFSDSQGNEFVAIADNADPFMHIVVFNANTGAVVAAQTVFTAFPFANSCENSLIAVNDSVMIENNYGNSSIGSTAGSGTTVPGVARIDFDPASGLSTEVWENDTVAIPSIVSQLSTGDGLFYGYAKNASGWYWVALSYFNGATVAATPVPLSNEAGGVLANNYYGGITVGPDGSAYAGVFGGLVVWRPLTVQNGLYVNATYEALLGRDADQAGLAFWTAQLSMGLSHNTFVLAIENTDEFRAAAIEDLYERYLNRPADSDGLALWVGFLGTGGTIKQVAASILASPEYYQLQGGTDADFLAGLYQDTLSRSIDPAAEAIFSQELAAGVPRFVITSFVANSPESDIHLVAELYLRFLNRPVDPAGLAFWTAQLQNGTRVEYVIAGLVGSDEYFTYLP